jgi:flagellar motor switch protein FliN/FliY
MSSIPEGQLDNVVASMLASAGHVLSALVDRDVVAGASTSSVSESSLRVEDDWVATITNLPAAGVSFVARYPKSDLAKIVGLMVGAESDGEMDAMQLSIVSETVAQISSAMGEQLAQTLGSSNDGIVSEVVAETGTFPAPPFTTYEAELDIGMEIAAHVQLDFDGVALSKMGLEKAVEPAGAPAAQRPPAAAQQVVAAASAPQPFAASSPGARRVAPSAPAQSAQFAPMQPTGVQAAAPGHANLDLVHDIPLQISAVLGQTNLALRDVVAMQAGSVFELDKLSADPIDLYVNNILIARGEVVVVDDKYAVKISELNPLQHERT